MYDGLEKSRGHVPDASRTHNTLHENATMPVLAMHLIGNTFWQPHIKGIASVSY